MIDRAFDPALQDEIFFGAELTLETQRRTEHGDLAFPGGEGFEDSAAACSRADEGGD